jgi:hypothetical protein
MVVFNKQQEPAGTILDIFKKDWNSSGLNRSPGKYEKEYDSYCAECEGEYVPFKFLWRYKVDKKTYFKKVPIDKMKGFLDEQTGVLTPNEFTTEAIDTQNIEKTWEPVENFKGVTEFPTIVSKFIKKFA